MKKLLSLGFAALVAGAVLAAPSQSLAAEQNQQHAQRQEIHCRGGYGEGNQQRGGCRGLEEGSRQGERGGWCWSEDGRAR